MRFANFHLVSVLFENAAGQVVADPAGFLRLNWGAQLRSATDASTFLTAAAQHLTRLGYSCLLVNQVQMPPFTPDEQQWISSHWLPVAVASGYRFGAILVATNVLTRLATSFITTSVQNLPLRYRSFDSEAEAVQWLLQQA